MGYHLYITSSRCECDVILHHWSSLKLLLRYDNTLCSPMSGRFRLFDGSPDLLEGAKNSDVHLLPYFFSDGLCYFDARLTYP